MRHRFGTCYATFGTLGLFCLIPSLSFADPSKISPGTDLALGKDTSLSDNGWGGGWNKTDLTNGYRTYDDGVWARGLALPWDGQAHQITVDFGAATTIGSVIQWHHGAGIYGFGAETPGSYTLQYWNLGANQWSTIMTTNDPNQYLLYPTATEDQWWSYWSTPYENSFAPVTTDKLRIWMTPVAGRYNWVWQVEAYAPTSTPEPVTTSILVFGLLAAYRVKRRRSTQ